MAYCGLDFTEAEPTEANIYGFDFWRSLGAAETIDSATFVLDVADGTDPDPASHLLTGADIQATQILVEIGGLLDGVRYRLTGIAVTSLGREIPLHSYVLSCGVTP